MVAVGIGVSVGSRVGVTDAMGTATGVAVAGIGVVVGVIVTSGWLVVVASVKVEIGVSFVAWPVVQATRNRQTRQRR